MPAMPRRISPWLRFRPRGFTLIELLVVIAIIGLISAVALPVVLPALNERRVSEAARIVQATLAGTRDAAIRANAPRGIRLLPDPVFSLINSRDSSSPTGFAANRIIPIEPAPDYSEGVIRAMPTTIITSTGTTPDLRADSRFLQIAERGYSGTVATGLILNSPTGWKYNIRQGDKIRFNDSGAAYTIAGPIRGLKPSDNPERYICYLPAGLLPAETPATNAPNASFTSTWISEYLNLTNGIDDDHDGWVDESCDGIDNDGDGIIDPGFNGLDDDGKLGVDNPDEMFWNATLKDYSLTNNEFEQEVFLGIQAQTGHIPDGNYTISRRPVVTPGGAETTLPAGTVIDLTTWNAAAAVKSDGTVPYDSTGTYRVVPLPERSRLPVDPFSGYVDIMIDQTGRVVPPGAGSGAGTFTANSPLASLPFYHFWITERDAVVPPMAGLYVLDTSTNHNPVFNVPILNPGFTSSPAVMNFLPVPQGTFDSGGNAYSGTFLKGERRLLTLFTKTGQIVSNSIESFNVSDTSTPYYAAQSGIRESQ